MSEPCATVFVLDDDATVCEAIGDLLNSVGLDARLFLSPDNLIENISEAACLILDVYLAGVNGLDVQQRLANEEIDLPIIFLSGKADIPISVRAMKAGAAEFLTKPVRDKDLLDAVQQALVRSQAMQQQKRGLALLRERYETLTAREKEVMSLVISGLLNK